MKEQHKADIFTITTLSIRNMEIPLKNCPNSSSFRQNLPPLTHGYKNGIKNVIYLQRGMEGILRFIKSHTGSQILKEFDSLHLIPKPAFLGMWYQSTNKTSIELLCEVLV